MGTGFTRRIKGSEFIWDPSDLEDGLEQTEENVPKAVGAGLYEMARRIIQSARPKTPVVTGQLKRSVFATKPIMGAVGPFVIVGYGAKYAIKVHETPNFSKKWKYLKRALDEHESKFSDELAKVGWKFFKQGKGLLISSPSDIPERPPQMAGG